MNHELYMRRCLELAALAHGHVRLNPNVGSVLVHQNRVIGEGYYEFYGGDHAEVNAFNSVKITDRHLIPESYLYVSLEPCNFHGKTPPCSERILKEGVKNLFVGCKDPNPRIAGSSISYLREKGIKVTSGILETECKRMIEPFSVNILKNRPYVTIKFAQSKDFFISQKEKQTWLSNEYSKHYSHKLRAENHAILIGTNTALIDNPSLTNRLHYGTSPLRVIIDKENKIPRDHHLIADSNPLLIINQRERPDLGENKEQWTMDIDLSILLRRLYKEKEIGRMIVEGGAKTIKEFVKSGFWDRAIIVDTQVNLSDGIKAPNIVGSLVNELQLGSDCIRVIESINCREKES